MHLATYIKYSYSRFFCYISIDNESFSPIYILDDNIFNKINRNVPKIQKIEKVSHQPSSTKSLIIFDYDNTLFPTALYRSIFNSGNRKMSNVSKEVMFAQRVSLLDVEVTNMLKIILQLNTNTNNSSSDIKIVIVSNGDLKWIQSSLKKYLPKCFQLLQESKCEIISACDKWMNEFPKMRNKNHSFDVSFKWKYNEFQFQIQKYFMFSKMGKMKNNLEVKGVSEIKNDIHLDNDTKEEEKDDILLMEEDIHLISIGDSVNEYFNAKDVCQKFYQNSNNYHIFLHRIKLKNTEAKYAFMNEDGNERETLHKIMFNNIKLINDAIEKIFVKKSDLRYQSASVFYDEFDQQFANDIEENLMVLYEQNYQKYLQWKKI